jgi:hypothetical protein
MKTMTENNTTHNTNDDSIVITGMHISMNGTE